MSQAGSCIGAHAFSGSRLTLPYAKVSVHPKIPLVGSTVICNANKLGKVPFKVPNFDK